MVIANNYSKPIQRAKPRQLSASDLTNGVTGTGPIVLNTEPTVNFPTVMDAPRVITTTGTATVDVLSTDTVSGVSIYQSSTPATTVQLPTTQGIYPVIDGSLNSGTYPITILPPSGLTILGQTSYQLSSNGASVTFANDGTQVVIT